MPNQLTWGPRMTCDGLTPYVDWWKRVSRPFGQVGHDDNTSGIALISQFPVFDPSATNGTATEPIFTVPEAPIPDFARDSEFADGIDAWIPDAKALPDVDLDTVIVGVIDTGIPLGHGRWRKPDMSSRILASWQQMAPVNKKSPSKVPFGRAYLKAEIEDLIKVHSGGDLGGNLDEDAFNRATGVVNFTHPIASREAAGRYSHGAHVLDAAAGAEPTGKSAFRDKVAIITVNLPGAAVFGQSGTYLDGLMMYAVGWICQMADAIWLKARRKKDPGWTFEENLSEQSGFPMAINISFGKQAGSKTSMDPFGFALKCFQDFRKADKRRVMDVIMPVGNDNLARCYALTQTHGGSMDDLVLRVVPEDHSASFVEIWTELCSWSEGDPNDTIRLHVSPPGGGEDGEAIASDGVRFLKRDHGDPEEEPTAAVYRDKIPGEATNSFRIRHTLCVAPTFRPDGRGSEAPSGDWSISIENLQEASALKTFLSVQTDQAILPGRVTARRAYFDDPNYQSVNEDTGRPIGSYETIPKETRKPENRDLEDVLKGSKVRRHGTLNATVMSKNITCVGGYRASDGASAPYSSTGRGRWKGADDGGGDESGLYSDDLRRGPTASLPTDDGPAHFGTLAAGAGNGSVVAMQGTSFASAQATRIVAGTLIGQEEITDSGNARLFQKARENEEDPDNAMDVEADIDTRGGGRVLSRSDTRVQRTDRI